MTPPAPVRIYLGDWLGEPLYTDDPRVAALVKWYEVELNKVRQRHADDLRALGGGLP